MTTISLERARASFDKLFDRVLSGKPVAVRRGRNEVVWMTGAPAQVTLRWVPLSAEPAQRLRARDEEERRAGRMLSFPSVEEGVRHLRRRFGPRPKRK